MSSSLIPITPLLPMLPCLVSLQHDCSVSHAGTLSLSQTLPSDALPSWDNMVELTRATVFLFYCIICKRVTVGGRKGQCQCQDSEGRTNPFKLNWTCQDKKTLGTKKQSCGMIEVELGGVQGCINTH